MAQVQRVAACFRGRYSDDASAVEGLKGFHDVRHLDNNQAWRLMTPLLAVMIAVISWPSASIPSACRLRMPSWSVPPAHLRRHRQLCAGCCRARTSSAPRDDGVVRGRLGDRRNGARRCSRPLLLNQQFRGRTALRGSDDPALGVADRSQRHAVAADLQSGIRRPERGPDADRH